MNQNYGVSCDTLFIFKKFKALKLILRVFEIVCKGGIRKL